VAFNLKNSERVWKSRHTYRQARLTLWLRRESYRYGKWAGYKATEPSTSPLRAKWWKLYQEADEASDKWLGSRDEASAILKRRRGQLTARRDKMSANFDVSEFDTHDGTKVPAMAYDGLRDLCVNVLEPMRAKFGAALVVSGHRHKAYNAGIGGASRGYHIYDFPGRGGKEVAADVVFARGTPAQWAAYARGLGRGGVGQYDRSGFCHVDNGPVRSWNG
jgi:hypothetical protein